MPNVERRPSSYSPTFSDTVTVPAGRALVFVSGQVGVPMTGRPDELSFADEVRVMFERVQTSLAQAGASMADVVKIQAYLTDLSLYGEYSRVRGSFFPSEPPSSTAVGVGSLLLGARVEVDAIAVGRGERA